MYIYIYICRTCCPRFNPCSTSYSISPTSYSILASPMDPPLENDNVLQKRKAKKEAKKEKKAAKKAEKKRTKANAKRKAARKKKKEEEQEEAEQLRLAMIAHAAKHEARRKKAEGIKRQAMQEESYKQARKDLMALRPFKRMYRFRRCVCVVFVMLRSLCSIC